MRTNITFYTATPMLPRKRGGFYGGGRDSVPRSPTNFPRFPLHFSPVSATVPLLHISPRLHHAPLSVSCFLQFQFPFRDAGVDDKELPEQMLMACKYSKPDIDSLPWFPDLTKEPAPDMSDLKTYLPSRCTGGEPEPGPADLLSKRDGEEGRGARRGSTRAEHNDTPSPT